MNSNRPIVVGFGEFLWDVLPTGAVPGGAPANFAWHAQQLGAEGIVVSAVGDDIAGRQLIGWLEKVGLSTASVQKNDRPTGRVDVRVGSDGEPGYVIDDDSAWDAIIWTDSLELLARRADAVCFGSLGQRSLASRGTLYRFLKATRPECLRMFDVNLRNPLPAAGIIKESLDCTNVLKFNEAEWPFIANKVGLNPDWAIGTREMLNSSSVRLVAVTRGARGSVVMTDHQRFELPAEQIDVVDAVGAGDAFAAALAVSHLQGLTLRQGQAIASKIAGYVCTQTGATPELSHMLRACLEVPMPSVHVPQALIESTGRLPASVTVHVRTDRERTAAT